MSDYGCVKVKHFNTLILNLAEIKQIINFCLTQKIEKLDKADINKTDKNKMIKDLNKKLTPVINKHNIIHNKLYNIIDIISNYECSISLSDDCKKDNFCINSKENEELWMEVDELYNKLNVFYYEIHISLIRETEFCLFKLNKIKKISYLLA